MTGINAGFAVLIPVFYFLGVFFFNHCYNRVSPSGFGVSDLI
jgi:hypothetical protein